MRRWLGRFVGGNVGGRRRRLRLGDLGRKKGL